MVKREQEAVGGGGERRQLAALAGQAHGLMQGAQAMLASCRSKAAATLRFLGEEVPAEPALSQAEPRRMLTDLADFLALLHRATADSDRMAVCLATLRGQREEEEREARQQRRQEQQRGDGTAAAATAGDGAAAAAAEVAAGAAAASPRQATPRKKKDPS